MTDSWLREDPIRIKFFSQEKRDLIYMSVDEPLLVLYIKHFTTHHRNVLGLFKFWKDDLPDSPSDVLNSFTNTTLYLLLIW